MTESRPDDLIAHIKQAAQDAQMFDRYPEFTLENPHIPWRNMRGMRNRFAHGYFDIDLNIVWDTVQNAVPGLIKQIDKSI